MALHAHSHTNQDILKDPKWNPANFLSFLRYRVASGDILLSNHLQHYHGNDSYTIKSMQSELISIFGRQINDTFLSDIKNACFFLPLCR